MKKKWWIAGGVVLLAIVAGGAIYLYATKSFPSLLPDGLQGVLSDSSDSTSQTILYSNQQYHFSVMYPSDLQVKTYGGGGNAFTVVFQDPTTNEGFQVFVIPYDQSQITKARFQLDEPSGVMQDETQIVIGGVPAILFYGSNQSIGDTREVWFINKGLLYEVTTYKQLDSWLANIMGTWQFIQ